MTRRLLSTQAASAAEDLAAGTLTETTIEIQSTTVTIDDKNIELGSTDSPSDTTADGGGITLKGTTDKTILWENDDDSWHFNQGVVVDDGDIELAPTTTSTAHIKVPAGSLDIRCANNLKMGTDGADSVRIGRDNTTAVKVHVRSGDDADLVVTNSKVGLGTETPGTQLQLEGTAPYVTLKNSTAENTAGGCESKVIFEDHADVALAQVEGSHSGSSDDTKGKLILSTHTGSALTAAVTIDDAQDVTFAADVTVTGDIVLDDGGSLKEAGGTAAITFDGSGHVTKIGQDSPSSADVLTYDGSKWVASAPTVGDITGVTASTGLSGGGTSGGVSLSIDSTVCTLTGSQTLTNKTLTEPKFADDGFIADANGNEQLEFVIGSASATNAWSMTNAANGGSPTLEVIGSSDSNVNATIMPKGTGVILLGTGSANAAVSSNGAHNLTLATNAGTNSGSITITGGVNNNISLTPNGSGKVAVGPADGTGILQSDGDYDLKLQTGNSTTGNITITDGADGDITLTCNGTGLIEMASPTHLNGVMVKTARKTANYSMTSADHTILASRSITISLPENSDAGSQFCVKRVDDGTSDGAITVSRSGSDTIDGANTKSLADNYDSITVVSDGADYFMVAETLNEEEGGGGGGP